MKSVTPAANIIIATLYLFIIIAIGYVIKLIFRIEKKPQQEKSKYCTNNLIKGLSSPLMQKNISPLLVLLKSLIYKYCVVGTFINRNKCYLLKEIFIMAVISVACCPINWITLWPVALAIVFTAVFFIFMQYFKLPFVLNISPRVEQQQKEQQIEAQRHLQLQIQPGMIIPKRNNYMIDQSQNQPVKIPKLVLQEQRESSSGQQHRQEELSRQIQTSRKSRQVLKQQTVFLNNFSYKYIGSLAVLCLCSLILISQAMFTIYNSISNLGALNIGSVVCVILIDQALCRPACGAILFLIVKIMLIRMQRSQVYQANAQNQQEVKNNNLKIFQFLLFRNLGEQILIQSMNQLYNQYGEPSNYQMGVSPTKKKTYSPSKVPKANIQELQSDTFVNLEGEKHQQSSFEEKPSQEQKKVEDIKSPIKQIQNSMLFSGLFTTIQKKIFGCYQEQNDQSQINKSKQLSDIQKIKVNSNQFFSVQRLPKDQLHHEEIMEDDGIVLIQAGMNLVKQKQMKYKPNTIDIDFSPTKKRKRGGIGLNPKRRQLIITGSSPYLQYLPDMMKKDKHNKKNMTPSHNQLPVSRKVL